jgi:hypothetical protein
MIRMSGCRETEKKSEPRRRRSESVFPRMAAAKNLRRAGAEQIGVRIITDFRDHSLRLSMHTLIASAEKNLFRPNEDLKVGGTNRRAWLSPDMLLPGAAVFLSSCLNGSLLY